HVTIPATALEIVRHPAEYGEKNSGDEFCVSRAEGASDYALVSYLGQS
nr:hypothetical protein [Tanacetum cinerariifolium]